jgi:hypothetical protein
MQERPSAGKPDRLSPQHVQDDRDHFALVGRDRRHRRDGVTESQTAVLRLESAPPPSVHGLTLRRSSRRGSRIRAIAPAIFGGAAAR